jgi:hypothetical protein
MGDKWMNPLNAELNPICHLLTLAEAHHFVDVSRIRVNIKRVADLHIVETLRLYLKYLQINNLNHE